MTRSETPEERAARHALARPLREEFDRIAAESGGADPELLVRLRAMGERWGPLGVALAAASLTDPAALIDRLAQPGPAVYGIRGHRTMTAEEAAEAQRLYELSPMDGLRLAAQLAETLPPPFHVPHVDALACPPTCACGGRGIDPETEHPTQSKEV